MVTSAGRASDHPYVYDVQCNRIFKSANVYQDLTFSIFSEVPRTSCLVLFVADSRVLGESVRCRGLIGGTSGTLKSTIR